MKTVILAGGRGTRISSETENKPKALVEIGGRPILWHILKTYERQGFANFIIALGYRGDDIQRYFAELGDSESWSVELVDTGLDTQSGGRVKRLAPLLGRESFMLTWCDGLSDVDLQGLIAFHRTHGRIATLTAVHPPPRFGELRLEGDRVAKFDEKPVMKDSWINGAFFVLEPSIFDHIAGDASEWERGTLEPLAQAGQLMAWRHEGFWQCMDTLKDKETLEALWANGARPWVVEPNA